MKLNDAVATLNILEESLGMLTQMTETTASQIISVVSDPEKLLKYYQKTGGDYKQWGTFFGNQNPYSSPQDRYLIQNALKAVVSKNAKNPEIAILFVFIVLIIFIIVFVY